VLELKAPRGYHLRAAAGRVLDWIFSPVIGRLTNEEYFSCRTRLDCTRALLRRVARA
jgi:hypothetical protein